ncbi:dTDP-4-keto-6-deoxy-D-glucose epimerase [Verminephrobacter aporrectodeae subsp. tuberculatae]|uniref:dTDP-4-dehydrorhamnose 3,5-epimerase family protein n=1 Tax=Verminephrobacter aporrectodeae TaxID=1110389 RepID=UPI0022445C6E|nr:dTDP-4-dehydrorhamnose 3,5-epimerase family protein [Verminephrobacter aporrectodeae]MCW8165065.1 dTDP-4-keto-6-deoxy-D-glucose epimerase [Verminephrobacter aporrectodeae subsp. tuberculatae]MCW8168887.1 dTDP-4-keto-6-deoxy-D-glucose epimerase [Verminephrobacter aporrectodeae subsp. tuberculatae]
MSRLVLTPLLLAGLFRVQRLPREDDRGAFTRLFCAQELASAGWTAPVVQINHSRSAQRGCLRGMHYQRPPHAEMKLVSCLRGAVWDVALDLRHGSSSFLQWHAEFLSADNGRALLIPPGFAHGFQALTDDAELLYCHTCAHAPAAQAGVHPLDPRLAIVWPLPTGQMSEHDAGQAALPADFEGLRL